MQQPGPEEKTLPYLDCGWKRPKNADLIIFFVAICAAFFIGFRDYEIVERFVAAGVHDTTFRRAMNVLGKAEIALLFVVLLCWITGNRRFLWRFLCSGIVAGIIILAMKFAISRERPRAGGFDSFPSGHAQVAFVWATIVAAEFPKFAVPAYAAAFCVGFFRVAVEAHFLSDVIVGAAIGYIVARMVVENIGAVPRWVYAATKRTSTGLAGVAAFALYALFFEERMLWAASVIVPVAILAVHYRNRKNSYTYSKEGLTDKDDQ